MNDMIYAAFNLNFDSLGEAYGFPSDYRDKSFTEVAKRFLALADKYGFKYSIFVIGKDLEKPENREVVKEWSLLGHEIGNHSWSHPMNLGAMDESKIRHEVEKAHEIITKTIEREPKGFIAPGWSTSSKLQKILIELDYTYDTSSFPSWLMYASLFKILLNHIGDRRFFKTLHRKDYLYPLLGQRNAFYSKGNIYGGSRMLKNGSIERICVLPLPTNRYRIACWHTLHFVLGWTLHKKLLKSCLEQVDAFYYLMHPADLLDRSDLDPARKIHWERLDVSLEKKRNYLEQSIELILESGRKIVTMQELALKYRAEGSEKLF
jgi:hypothetical protein